MSFHWTIGTLLELAELEASIQVAEQFFMREANRRKDPVVMPGESGRMLKKSMLENTNPRKR